MLQVGEAEIRKTYFRKEYDWVVKQVEQDTNCIVRLDIFDDSTCCILTVQKRHVRIGFYLEYERMLGDCLREKQPYSLNQLKNRKKLVGRVIAFINKEM